MTTSMHCTCGALLPLEVLHSAAGFYLGYFCPGCGPYARVSHYFETQQFADEALETLNATFRALQPTQV